MNIIQIRNRVLIILFACLAATVNYLTFQNNSYLKFSNIYLFLNSLLFFILCGTMIESKTAIISNWYEIITEFFIVFATVSIILLSYFERNVLIVVLFLFGTSFGVFLSWLVSKYFSKVKKYKVTVFLMTYIYVFVIIYILIHAIKVGVSEQVLPVLLYSAIYGIVIDAARSELNEI